MVRRFTPEEQKERRETAREERRKSEKRHKVTCNDRVYSALREIDSDTINDYFKDHRMQYVANSPKARRGVKHKEKLDSVLHRYKFGIEFRNMKPDVYDKLDRLVRQDKLLETLYQETGEFINSIPTLSPARGLVYAFLGDVYPEEVARKIVKKSGMIETVRNCHTCRDKAQ